jgi:hypothetical protein
MFRKSRNYICYEVKLNRFVYIIMSTFEKFIDLYLKYHPSLGSQHGFCRYDDKLEDVTISNLNKELKELSDFNDKYNDSVIKVTILKRVNEINIWKRYQTDPNYYFNILYNSIFYITERAGYTITDEPHERIKKMKNFIDIMLDNLKEINTKYLDIFKDNIGMIDGLNISGKNKKYIKTLLELAYKKMKNLPIKKSYALGYDNLQKILSDNEQIKDLDIKNIYEYAIKEQNEVKQEFLKSLEKYGSIENYDEKYFQINIAVEDFISFMVDKLLKFIEKKKLLDIDQIKKPLVIEKSETRHMSINEVLQCVDKKVKKSKFNLKNHIKLYISSSSENKFNYVTYINTIVHETMHYIQYEVDADNENKMSAMFSNISTGEGVAHFMEEYIYDANFLKKLYKVNFLYDRLFRIARFIVGYEIHVNNISYDDAIARYKELALYDDDITAHYDVGSLISDTYNFEYYLGKYLIKEHIKKNPKFDVNNLFKFGSIPLKNILI